MKIKSFDTSVPEKVEAQHVHQCIRPAFNNKRYSSAQHSAVSVSRTSIAQAKQNEWKA
jgi:hypothetical protein